VLCAVTRVAAAGSLPVELSGCLGTCLCIINVAKHATIDLIRCARASGAHACSSILDRSCATVVRKVTPGSLQMQRVKSLCKKVSNFDRRIHVPRWENSFTQNCLNIFFSQPNQQVSKPSTGKGRTSKKPRNVLPPPCCKCRSYLSVLCVSHGIGRKLYSLCKQLESLINGTITRHD